MGGATLRQLRAREKRRPCVGALVRGARATRAETAVCTCPAVNVNVCSLFWYGHRTDTHADTRAFGYGT